MTCDAITDKNNDFHNVSQSSKRLIIYLVLASVSERRPKQQPLPTVYALTPAHTPTCVASHSHVMPPTGCLYYRYSRLPTTPDGRAPTAELVAAEPNPSSRCCNHSYTGVRHANCY